MMIPRTNYLKVLIDRRDDDRVKVLTGIRRCGKSYLLFRLFVDWLRANGVDDRHIVALQLDDDEFVRERRPEALSAYVRERLPKDGGQAYVLINIAKRGPTWIREPPGTTI